tara:strand:- start:905 stop:1084 length:180 start_codon:yes stop_codon:yes gene_type:complete
MTTQHELDSQEISMICSCRSYTQKTKNRFCTIIEARMYKMEQAELDGKKIGHDYYTKEV